MLKHLYLIFIATFLLGFVTGGVVYLKSHTGEERNNSASKSIEGFTISAHMYGGCERGGCSLYNIESDGSYIFIMNSWEGGQKKYEAQLIKSEREVLKTQLSGVDFVAIKNTRFTGTCPITYDGISYRYSIEYKGEHYEIDSCIESTDSDPLFKTLENYFGIFEQSHTTVSE